MIKCEIKKVKTNKTKTNKHNKPVKNPIIRENERKK